jgi:oxidase EvaA
VEQIPFDELDRWHFEQVSGNLAHESGRFFVVRGLRVRDDAGVLRYQPIIDQFEIGILGIVVKEFRGVLHCLMQAKAEPGNVNELQLSPTVQATFSNYTRVHGGRSVQYLEFFTGGRPARVLVDVLQSEQGAWFWRKQNRNMVVQVTGDIPLHENFCWLTVRQLRELLGVENVVNMDTRSVLACLPFASPSRWAGPPADRFTEAVVRSYQPESASGATALHPLAKVLEWFAEAKARCGLRAELVSLDDIERWSRTAREIVEQEQRYFRIIAVRVAAAGREVNAWTQPLLAPFSIGLAAFIARRVNGVVHVLVQALAEPGLRGVVELAPTVMIRPEKDGVLPTAQPFADDVTAADDERIRFDAVLSEEGGRLYHAQTRYRVVDVGEDFPIEVPWDFCWLTLQQLMMLSRNGNYLNVEARSLLACIHSLW